MLRPLIETGEQSDSTQGAELYLALLDDLRKLKDAAAPSSEASTTDITVQLGSVRSRVVDHFRSEEESHCLESLREEQPRLGHAAEELLAEHRQLVESLDQIIATIRTASCLDDQARIDVANWLDRFRQHEIHEEDLVQEAYNRDLGAAD